jgi:hypothetical protein
MPSKECRAAAFSVIAKKFATPPQLDPSRMLFEPRQRGGVMGELRQ